MIGSFALLLAVPTGFEPAERNWFGGWFSMCKLILIVSLVKCQADESNDSFSKSPSLFPEAARAIADLTGGEEMQPARLAEVLQYRSRLILS